MDLKSNTKYRIHSNIQTGYQLKASINFGSSDETRIYAGRQLDDDDNTRDRQLWYFDRQSDLSYYIRNAYNGGSSGPSVGKLLLQLDADTSGDRRAVCMTSNGDLDTRYDLGFWKIEQTPGGIRLLDYHYGCPLKASADKDDEGDYPIYGGYGGVDTDPYRFIFRVEEA